MYFSWLYLPRTFYIFIFPLLAFAFTFLWSHRTGGMQGKDLAYKKGKNPQEVYIKDTNSDAEVKLREKEKRVRNQKSSYRISC